MSAGTETGDAEMTTTAAARYWEPRLDRAHRRIRTRRDIRRGRAAEMGR